MIDLLIADDHDVVIAGIKNMLEGAEDITIKKVVKDGQAVIDALAESHYDVVLLDIDMPIKDGIEVVRELGAKTHPSRIIMLSMHDKIVMIETLLDLGVKGYLRKTAPKEVLIDSIRGVMRGEVVLESELSQRLLARMRSEDNSSVRITPRERLVLELLAKGLSSQEVSDEMSVSIHTTNGYRKSLLSKTGCTNVIELLNWAREHEYIP